MLYLLRWITDYFSSADVNGDGHLEFEEVWVLLKKMSVKMSKKEAKRKFHVSGLETALYIILSALLPVATFSLLNKVLLNLW